MAKDKAVFNPYSAIDDELDAIEKDFSLTNSSLDKSDVRTSTGLLMLDVILGGGIVGGGWYTLFGAEQSAKSTTAMTIMSNMLKTDIPIAGYFDYEGCFVGETWVKVNDEYVVFKDLLSPTHLNDIERDPNTPRFLDSHIENVNTVGGKVSARLYYRGIVPITEIITATGRSIKGYNHPMLVPDGNGYKWKKLEELKLGDIAIAENKVWETIIAVRRNIDIAPTFDLSLNNSENCEIPHSIYTNGLISHNSTTPDYIENIMKSSHIKGSIDDLFGIKDAKSGKWLVKPRVRYYPESIGERFFDYVSKLERTLPDKIKVGDEWYYVYPNTKPNQKMLKDSYDLPYYRSTGKYRIPALNGGPQALMIVDSYPAMLPERMDVDDPSSAMAMQARMFSENIKRIKGKMKTKRISVIGVNQLRLSPGVTYGSPEYEPGGQSLKFFSDARIRLSARSIPHGKGMIEEEPSVTVEGNDTYRYINARAIKNKLSIPYLEGMLRIWIADGEGVARGFCPVYDTYAYLVATGQVEGNRNSLRIKLPGKESSKGMKWLEFKELILGAKGEIAAICKKYGLKPFHIRVCCQKQLATGDGMERFFATKANKAKNTEDDSE